MPGDANYEVAGFVWTVYDDLDSLIDMRGPLLVPPELETTGDDRERLALFAAQLAETWPAVMDTRPQIIDWILGLDEYVLALVGLTGMQLETKLLIWRRARDFLDRALLEFGDEETGESDLAYSNLPEGVAPGGKIRRFLHFKKAKPICKWTSRTLDHADTLLGSLVKLAPFGEKLIEIKETVQKLTGELAEDLPD